MTQVVSDDVLGQFARKQNDWFTRVRAGSLDPKVVGDAIQAIIDRQANYLVPLDEAEILLVATRGGTTIAGSADVFTGYLDSGFKKPEFTKSGRNTRPAKLKVLEQCRNGTLMQLFTSITANLDFSCLTQGQIVQYCRDNSAVFKDGCARLFLFKAGEEYFVAGVDVGGAGLVAYVFRLGGPNVWHAEDRYRVVVPQLAA